MATAPESGVSHGARTLLAGAKSRARAVGGGQRLPPRQPDRDRAHLGTDTGVLGCVARPAARCGEPSARLVSCPVNTLLAAPRLFSPGGRAAPPHTRARA